MNTTTKLLRFRVTYNGHHYENAPTGLIALQRVHAKLLKKNAEAVFDGKLRGEIVPMDETLGSFAAFKAMAGVKESLRY